MTARRPVHDVLVDLLGALSERGYRFVTPGHGVIRRMRERARSPATLRDIFGWSLLFQPADLPAELFRLMEAGDLLTAEGQSFRSKVRVSEVEGQLFLHSAFPTSQTDSVFLGPDSYRFAALIRSELREGRLAGRVVDIGAGAGVGALVAASAVAAAEVVLTDVNPRALAFAAANAAHAGQAVTLCEGPGLSAADGLFDLILANPPFIAGGGQTYKAGGDLHGARVSLDWAVEGLGRLSPGGRMILYTGSPILVGGEDELLKRLALAATSAGCALAYRELDPDIFSGELRRDAYADVERIAAIAAILTRPS